MILKVPRLPKVPYAWLLLGPWILFGVGFAMNAFVMAMNGGQMPVLWPGGCSGMPTNGDDIVHSCMTHATHFKWLADWIVINHVGVASPGDFLEWAWGFIQGPTFIAWIALIIKDHNPTSNGSHAL